jgi:hypothetical protein
VFARRNIQNTSHWIGCRGAIDIHTTDIARAPKRTLLTRIIIAVQRRLEQRSDLEVIDNLDRPLTQLRREIDQVVVRQTLVVKSRRFGWKWLRLG